MAIENNENVSIFLSNYITKIKYKILKLIIKILIRTFLICFWSLISRENILKVGFNLHKNLKKIKFFDFFLFKRGNKWIAVNQVANLTAFYFHFKMFIL